MVEQILHAVGKSVPAAIEANPNAAEPDTNNPIPPIPGIDRRHANHTMDGSLEMFELLVKVFVEEFEGFETQMRKLLETPSPENRTTARRLAHSLRGSAKQLGALELSNAAAALEEAIQADSPGINLRLDGAIKLLADLLPSLKAYLG